MKVTLWLLLASSLEISTGFRILGFFPFPGTSHHNVFLPIMQELARRGHQVVYLTPFKPRFTHVNLDVRLIRDFKNELLGAVDLDSLRTAPAPLVIHKMSSATQELTQLFYGQPEAVKIIQGSEKFDAVLMESYFVQEPVSALIHKFGCVGVEITALGDSAWVNELSGLPDNPAYQVDFKTTYTDDMSLLQKVHNFYITWSTVLVSYYHLWRMQSIMDQYFNYTGWESRPSIYRLVSNRSMILVNRHVALDYPYPKAPHVQDIGGVNIVPNKPLPEDIKRYMDEAKHGVIYFSLGSNLNTSDFMSSDLGEALFSKFRQLPQNILMKWENDMHVDLPANVMTSKWLPQQDILAHNNCVLFITHGGFLSLSESVYHGVPLVGIPFFGDQPKNMKHVEIAGYGVKLELGNITKGSVSWALEEVLTNPSYKNEALKRSRMMRESDRPAVETAADWVEYAIKYPNALTPRAAYLSFIQLHMIDIFMFIIISLLLVYTIIRVIVSTGKTLFSKKKIKTA